MIASPKQQRSVVWVLKSENYCHGNATMVTLMVTMVECFSIATKVSIVSAQECKVLIVMVTQPRSL